MRNCEEYFQSRARNHSNHVLGIGTSDMSKTDLLHHANLRTTHWRLILIMRIILPSSGTAIRFPELS